MSNQYVGEIRMFAGNFAPIGWALCQGQLLSIAQNVALFSLIGTFYGGDGVNTFALPDLQGRIPIHQGSNGQLSTVLSEKAGAETVTLATQQIPAHRHAFVGGGGGGSSPSGSVLGTAAPDNIFTTGAVNGSLAGVSAAGGSQPHDNLMPYLCVNFIISLLGIFPTQN